MKFWPSHLSPELIKELRQYSIAAEAQGKLLDKQLQIIYQQKWFYLFVPENRGGLALSLPEAVRLEEEIAYVDGSLGWVVTLCAGAAMFVGFFSIELADEVFSDQNICIAGSGQVNGIAEKTDQGFIINGTWPYASGAPHARYFTANCMLEPEGVVKSFLFKRNEVTLHPQWKYLGLHATAGFSFSVKDLPVPFTRAFIIDPANAVLKNPVYTYPFLQLAETTIAANLAGMCHYFIDLAEEIFINKITSNERSKAIRNKGLELINLALVEMEEMRKNFYEALDRSWILHTSTNQITTCELSEVSEKSKLLAKNCRKLVNDIYPYCGMDAAKTDTAINQVWRNINTASQHSLLLKI